MFVEQLRALLHVRPIAFNSDVGKACLSTFKHNVFKLLNVELKLGEDLEAMGKDADFVVVTNADLQELLFVRNR